MPRFNKRTDKSQKDIVDALRKSGVQVIVTNFGQDFPDLLCGYRAVSEPGWVLIEIKEPDGSLDRGQLEFIANAKGRVGVATTFDEALALVRATDGISLLGKDAIDQWLLKNPTQGQLSVKKFRKVIA